MNKEIVLDIETKNTFDEVGEYEPSKLDLSLLVIYDYSDRQFKTFNQKNIIDLWPILEQADRIIGYNLFHFDYPILNKYYTSDISRFNTLDIMDEFRKKTGFKIKLDHLLNVNLGTKKIGNGLDAVKYWKEGRMDELEKYCREDVLQTRDLYEFVKQGGSLRYLDKSGQEQNVDLDFSDEGFRESVNFSLGI